MTHRLLPNPHPQADLEKERAKEQLLERLMEDGKRQRATALARWEKQHAREASLRERKVETDRLRAVAAVAVDKGFDELTETCRAQWEQDAPARAAAAAEQKKVNHHKAVVRHKKANLVIEETIDNLLSLVVAVTTIRSDEGRGLTLSEWHGLKADFVKDRLRSSPPPPTPALSAESAAEIECEVESLLALTGPWAPPADVGEPAAIEDPVEPCVSILAALAAAATGTDAAIPCRPADLGEPLGSVRVCMVYGESLTAAARKPAAEGEAAEGEAAEGEAAEGEAVASTPAAEGVLEDDAAAGLVGEACAALGLVHLSAVAVLAAAVEAAAAEAAGTLDDTPAGEEPDQARLAAKASLAEQGRKVNEATEAGTKPFDVTIATAFMAMLELEGADVTKRLKPIVPALPLGPDADEAQVAAVAAAEATLRGSDSALTLAEAGGVPKKGWVTTGFPVS